MSIDTSSPDVYRAISSVQEALSRVGIAKDQQMSGGAARYKFRGIDSIYNVLAPLLAEHGLLILPRVIANTLRERETSSGSVLFYSTLTVEYDFISVRDGSKHTVKTMAEAMDTSDKSINKALQAAYKYMAIQAFCIPTEGEEADAVCHEVKARPAQTLPPPVSTTPPPQKVTKEEWDNLRTVGLKNHWPEGFMKMWIRREMERRTDSATYTMGMLKFSAENTIAEQDPETEVAF